MGRPKKIRPKATRNNPSLYKAMVSKVLILYGVAVSVVLNCSGGFLFLVSAVEISGNSGVVGERVGEAGAWWWKMSMCVSLTK